MAGGNWLPGVSPGRPGLYINFTEAASDAIQAGNMGVVAMPYTGALGGTATAGNVYTVASKDQVVTLFGTTGTAPILHALKGGAKEVLVYTLTDGGTITTENIALALSAFDVRDFDVFVFDKMVSEDVQDAVLAWLQDNREGGKYFHAVFGCTNASDDMDVSNGIARSTRLADDFAVNLITGFVDGLTIYNSAQAAPFVAGVIAGTALNASTTYASLPFTDVNVRLTNAQIKSALASGCMVLVYDGEKVKIERGVSTSGVKIRRTRTQKAITSDISRTAANSFVGQVINNEDGQVALVSAIKAYMERLAADGVIDGKTIKVALSDTYPSTGDQVYIDLSFRDLDSVEEIFLTVQVG